MLCEVCTTIARHFLALRLERAEEPSVLRENIHFKNDERFQCCWLHDHIIRGLKVHYPDLTNRGVPFDVLLEFQATTEYRASYPESMLLHLWVTPAKSKSVGKSIYHLLFYMISIYIRL